MEPQKKGVMYVYKMATGSQNPAAGSTPEVTKKAVAARGYWGLRRSKSHRENQQQGGGKVAEGGGGEEVVVVEGRKSVCSEGRRSVCSEARKSAAVEVDVAAVAALLQVKILVTDMPGFMQIHAFRCARRTYDSLEKFSSKHIAYNMKKEFDKIYGPAWHCIVGSSFGSFVTHSTGGFLYFSMEKLCILIFKTKVLKA